MIATEAIVDLGDALRPEPLERFLYTTGVLLLPFCLLSAYLMVRRLLRGVPGFDPASVWLATATALGLLISGALAEGPENLRAFLPCSWFSLGAALALALCASSAPVRRFSERMSRPAWVLSGLAVATLLLGALGFAVFRRKFLESGGVSSRKH